LAGGPVIFPELVLVPMGQAKCCSVQKESGLYHSCPFSLAQQHDLYV